MFTVHTVNYDHSIWIIAKNKSVKKIDERSESIELRKEVLNKPCRFKENL
jgi:hypothetical protein